MNLLVVFCFFFAVFIGYNLVDDFDPNKLKGKNVVVTGASTGIGEQMAYHYAQFGANLLLTARSEKRLQEVIKRCEALGRNSGKYLYYVADMSDMTATEQLIKDAEVRLGGIDYLVLNHILLTTIGEWHGSRENLTMLHKTIDVNFLSYVHLASNSLKLLESTKGSIIVVSSLAGRVPQPYFAAYSASKFALDGFFSGLRQELDIKGIDVSITLCIIGLVGTDNAVKALTELRATNVLSWIPFAKSDDVALAIVRSGAIRAKELSCPYASVKFSTFLYTFIPQLLETLFRFIYKFD